MQLHLIGSGENFSRSKNYYLSGLYSSGFSLEGLWSFSLYIGRIVGPRFRGKWFFFLSFNYPRWYSVYRQLPRAHDCDHKLFPISLAKLEKHCTDIIFSYSLLNYYGLGVWHTWGFNYDWQSGNKQFCLLASPFQLFVPWILFMYLCHVVLSYSLWATALHVLQNYEMCSL